MQTRTISLCDKSGNEIKLNAFENENGIFVSIKNIAANSVYIKTNEETKSKETLENAAFFDDAKITDVLEWAAFDEKGELYFSNRAETWKNATIKKKSSKVNIFDAMNMLNMFSEGNVLNGIMNMKEKKKEKEEMLKKEVENRDKEREEMPDISGLDWRKENYNGIKAIRAEKQEKECVVSAVGIRRPGYILAPWFNDFCGRQEIDGEEYIIRAIKESI